MSQYSLTVIVHHLHYSRVTNCYQLIISSENNVEVLSSFNDAVIQYADVDTENVMKAAVKR